LRAAIVRPHVFLCPGLKETVCLAICCLSNLFASIKFVSVRADVVSDVPHVVLLAPQAGVWRHRSLRRSTGEVCAIGEAKRCEVINLEEFVTYVHDHLQGKNLRDPATVDILNEAKPQSTLEGKVRATFLSGRYDSLVASQMPVSFCT